MEDYYRISGIFAQKHDNDPIKQDIDPINDPISILGLSEREKKVLGLLRQDPTLTRAKMTVILATLVISQNKN